MVSTSAKGLVEIRIRWRGARLAAEALSVGLSLSACGGTSETSGAGGSGATSAGGAGGAGTGGVTSSGGTGGATSTGGTSTGGMSTGGTTTTSSTTSLTQPSGFLCNEPPPAGAVMPAALPAYTGGACPSLVAGENTLTSKGNARKFMLLFPADLGPDEKPPVLFLWHWLGGSAEDFIDKGQIQQAVDQQRFVAVVPRAKGDIQFHWPFSVADSDARLDEELTFFDDMLTCVASQFSANTSCVGSAGVSAGALFTDQLAARRDQYIASFLSLSGGVGGIIKPWANPERKLPGLVLWGGPTDNCFNLLKFDQESQTLEDNLTSQGNFFIECVHNCGHSEPPLDPPADGSSIYAPLWGFVFDHPYWLAAGQSPYAQFGMPASMPTWCGIGKGSATPRVGPCNGGGC